MYLISINIQMYSVNYCLNDSVIDNKLPLIEKMKSLTIHFTHPRKNSTNFNKKNKGFLFFKAKNVSERGKQYGKFSINST